VRPFYSPVEAAGLLADAWAADRGEEGWVDPVTLEALAWSLDADPEYLEETWQAWADELEAQGYTPTELDEARYWLDVVVIGGIGES